MQENVAAQVASPPMVAFCTMVWECMKRACVRMRFDALQKAD
jgi:hypothetical protein